MSVTPASIQAVQGYYKRVTSGNHLEGSLSGSLSVNAGDLVLVTFSSFEDDPATLNRVAPTITDSQGLTWNRTLYLGNAWAPNTAVGAYYALASGQGTLTYTLVEGAVNDEFSLNFTARAFAGVNASTPIGASSKNQAQVPPSASSFTIATATATEAAGAYVYAVFSMEGGSAASGYTETSGGWTQDAVNQNTSSSSGYWSGYKSAPITGFQSATLGAASVPDGGGSMLIFTILPSVGSPTPTPTPTPGGLTINEYVAGAVYAANNSYAAVAAAYAAANDLGIVVVPAGTGTVNWNLDSGHKLVLNQGKRVLLLFPGVDALTVNQTGTPGEGLYTIDIEDAGCSIMGLKLIGQLPWVVESGASWGIKIGGAAAASNKCRVAFSRFEGFSYSAVYVEGTVQRCLIHDCTFIDNFYPSSMNLGYGVQVSGLQTWPSMDLGTANACFVEACYFEGQKNEIGANGGCRYVFRHNVVRVKDSNKDWSRVDAHGYGGVGHGTRSYEVYANDFGVTGSLTWGARATFGPKGGDGVYWGNTISGNWVTKVWIRNETDPGNAYPVQDQISDLWMWNNTGAGTDYEVLYPNLTQLNRDFYIGTAKAGYAAYTYPHPDRLSYSAPTPSPSPTIQVALSNIGFTGTSTATMAGTTTWKGEIFDALGQSDALVGAKLGNFSGYTLPAASNGIITARFPTPNGFTKVEGDSVWVLARTNTVDGQGRIFQTSVVPGTVVVSGSYALGNTEYAFDSQYSGQFSVATTLPVSPSPTPTPTPTPAPTPPGTKYEAELATRNGSLTAETTYAGYTGTGYITYPSVGTAWLTWNVDGSTGGTCVVNVVYSYDNAQGAQSATLSVNGVAQSIVFSSTGGFASWSYVASASVVLQAGNNLVQLIGVNFAPKIDSIYVQVTPDLTSPTSFFEFFE